MRTETMAPDQAMSELLDRAWRVAETVADPELPMLTLADLGVLREISLDGGRLTVSLAPTYSGCPATDMMRCEVGDRLAAAGFADVAVRLVLSPPWSSDLISAQGRRKLAEAGIAPPRSRKNATGGPVTVALREPGGPVRSGAGPVPLTLLEPGGPVDCPRCGSADTQRSAAFGATACMDLHRCGTCGEPFEHVKEV